MFRLITFLSVIAIIIAIVARFWFGLRVLATDGKRRCRCDLNKWQPEPGDKEIIHRAENSANHFGRELRNKALAEWKKEAKKAAKSSEGARKFGLAVPPLSGIVAIFAVAVGRVPPIGAIAIFVAATAFAAIYGLLSLPAELAAIARDAKHTRRRQVFPNRDDENAVIRCANAHAWEAALPPILKWVQKTPKG